MSVVYYMMALPQNEVETLMADPDALQRKLFSGGENNLYLDKAWHGLHWLLAKNAGTTNEPLSKLILGGHEIGPELSFGRPRLHTVSEVADFSARLSQL